MITLPIDLEHIGADDKLTPLEAVLIYRPADPYAVKLDIVPPDGDRVVWEFGRDLLADGLAQRAGAGGGDVVIWPCTDGALHIMLRSPEGLAQLHTIVDDVDAFLEMTYAVVPRGKELDAVDVDQELNEIFGTAA